MTRDTIVEIVDYLVPAVRAVTDPRSLAILRALGYEARSVKELARDVGLSRQAVNRHLTALQEYGWIRIQPGSGNGRVYALDVRRAAMLNASLISLMSRLDSGDGAAEAEVQGPGPRNGTSAGYSAPDACAHCQYSSFVRELLDDLDESLVKAREYEASLRRMSSQILTAQEEERARLARELHDDTAQALTSVLVRLRLLDRSITDERLQGELKELRDLTEATLQGVRRLAIDLRPPMLDDLGLEKALQAHVQDFSRRWPLQATFTCGNLGHLDPEVELALYRVVQEALANVAKHSGASRVDVRLSRRGRWLRLRIDDDGSGFDLDAIRNSRASGLGLFGMEERLALVGGILRIESAPGRGVRVVAEAPLPGGRRG